MGTVSHQTITLEAPSAPITRESCSQLPEAEVEDLQERLTGAITEAGFQEYLLALPFIKTHMTSAHLIKRLERCLITRSEQGQVTGCLRAGLGSDYKRALLG